MKTIVVYGERDSEFPCVVTTKESMDAQRDLLLFDIEDPVLFESFEAYSWGHAMTYYQGKYFYELYLSEDPDVFKPFEEEETQENFFSVYRDYCELVYFKNKDNALSYIEEQVEKVKTDELTRELWEDHRAHVSLDWNKERARDCQLNIERFAEQLKSLDLEDKRNKGKINQLKSRIERNIKERDEILRLIRRVNDFESWQEEQIQECREGFILSEEKFEDE